MRKSFVFYLVLAALLLSTHALATNLVSNGSFEIGMGKWFGFDSSSGTNYNQITTAKTGLIDTGQHYLGNQSFKWTWPGIVRSPYIKLDSAKQYHISFYARSNAATAYDEEVQIALDSSYRTGTSGYGTRLQATSSWVQVASGGGWARYSAVLTPPASRNGYYKLWLTHWQSSPNNTSLWLDGIQVEEYSAGVTPRTYASATEAEIGITTGNESLCNLFNTSESINLTTKVFETAAPGSVTLNYSFYDYRGQLLSSTDRTLGLSSGYGTDTWTPSLSQKGMLSLVVTGKVSGVAKGNEELLFGRVSPGRTVNETNDQGSPLGIHADGWGRDVAAKLGIRWDRLHDYFDADANLYWSKVEPTTNNTWNWSDTGITRYRNEGFNMLGMLLDVPSWAGYEYAYPNMTNWLDYVGTASSRYYSSPKVKYWEVWNEPYSGSFLNLGGSPTQYYSTTNAAADDYYSILANTYNQVKTSAPNSQVVGGCVSALCYGNLQAFTDRLLADGGLNKMDILSVHNFGGLMMGSAEATLPEERCAWDGGSYKTASQILYDLTAEMYYYGTPKPMWNTETDVWSEPFSRLYPFVDDTPYNIDYPPMSPELGADYVVQSTAVSMANNCPKQFLYLMTGQGGFEDDMTNRLLSARLELKPSVVACSEFLQRLGQGTFYSQLNWGSNARCYLFTTDSNPVAVVWALRASKVPLKLHLSSGASSFTFNDIMGNTRSDVTISSDVTLPLGSEPVYISTSSISTLSSVLSSATFELTAGTVYSENFDIGDSGKTVIAYPINWYGYDPVDYPNFDVQLGSSQHSWTGNFIDGSTAASGYYNSLRKGLQYPRTGTVRFKCKAYGTSGSTGSENSHVGYNRVNWVYNNTVGGWVFDARGMGSYDSTKYQNVTGYYNQSVTLEIYMDFDALKTWGIISDGTNTLETKHFNIESVDWAPECLEVVQDRTSSRTGLDVDEISVKTLSQIYSQNFDSASSGQSISNSPLSWSNSGGSCYVSTGSIHSWTGYAVKGDSATNSVQSTYNKAMTYPNTAVARFQCKAYAASSNNSTNSCVGFNRAFWDPNSSGGWTFDARTMGQFDSSKIYTVSGYQNTTVTLEVYVDFVDLKCWGVISDGTNTATTNKFNVDSAAWAPESLYISQDRRSLLGLDVDEMVLQAAQ